MDKFPKKSKADYANSIAKGVLSAVPVAGGPLSVLFETVFSSPLDKRKEQWFHSLAEAIEKINEKVEDMTPEALSQNETFISASMQATQIALRSHQKEKLTALKNAIINSAIDISMDENKSLMFVRIIDEMTPIHLKVLAFLNNPKSFEHELQSRKPHNVKTHYGENINIWDEYYPEMRSSRDFILQVVKDLIAKGFIHSHVTLLGTGACTTSFGQEFLTFVGEQ